MRSTQYIAPTFFWDRFGERGQQKALAEVLGRSTTYASRAVSGKQRVNAREYANKIALRMGLGIDDIPIVSDTEFQALARSLQSGEYQPGASAGSNPVGLPVQQEAPVLRRAMRAYGIILALDENDQRRAIRALEQIQMEYYAKSKKDPPDPPSGRVVQRRRGK